MTGGFGRVDVAALCAHFTLHSFPFLLAYSVDPFTHRDQPESLSILCSVLDSCKQCKSNSKVHVIWRFV
jgi:hypothetical protein